MTVLHFAQVAFGAILIRMMITGIDFPSAIAFVASCALLAGTEFLKQQKKVAPTDVETRLQEMEHRLSSMAVSIAFKPVQNPLQKRV